MTTLTLLVRIYNTHQLKQLPEILSDLFGDLNVEVAIAGMPANRWVQVEVTGEDEEVATNLLKREIGFCPSSLDQLKKFSIVKGYVTNIEKSKNELLFDVGVFEPKIVHAAISLNRLQSQLAEGKELSLSKISELLGIAENLPLKVKVLRVETEGGTVEVELDKGQVEKYFRWRDSLLDRLIILGASLQEVNGTIEHEQLCRDIIEVESFGVFEHALVCKLGTDAAGLVGRIGRRLRKARFIVFNPKKIKL